MAEAEGHGDIVGGAVAANILENGEIQDGGRAFQPAADDEALFQHGGEWAAQIGGGVLDAVLAADFARAFVAGAPAIIEAEELRVQDPRMDRHPRQADALLDEPTAKLAQELARGGAAAALGDQPANGGCGAPGRHLRQFVRELALADD